MSNVSPITNPSAERNRREPSYTDILRDRAYAALKAYEIARGEYAKIDEHDDDAASEAMALVDAARDAFIAAPTGIPHLISIKVALVIEIMQDHADWADARDFRGLGNVLADLQMVTLA